jgi:anti-sigma regulatory factor (Ser/Thr protein kinase)
LEVDIHPGGYLMSDSPVRAEWRLRFDKTAPRTARGLIRETVGVPTGRLDELLLLVNEIVTNAVVHGSPEPDGQVGLRLEQEARTIRIVATDGGHHFKPEPAEPGWDRPHFGLYLIDKIADRWGVSTDGKKAVWFEIDL